jgi:phenylalanyl-tRNA synthetase beta chain
MRVPLSWLKEFVDITMPVDELAQRLTLAGLEVAEVERVGVEGADLPWDPEKIVVGNILEVRQHPNADRLVLADVDYGAAAPHTVVTGAPNLFEYKGLGRLGHPLKAVYAHEGAALYDGHAANRAKMVLKGRAVRGVMSDAMLCSEKELGLSDDHEGILLLPDDAPVGVPLRDYLGDVVFDIDLTPNLARALSVLGVAREVAALTGAPLHIPSFELETAGPSIEGRARVTVETPDLCPRFTATLIEGVRVGSAPLWMQRRLLLAGMRPINNIVDISNYVMLELGEPSHAFDADKVAGQHLVVRQARPGERLVTLDGKEHELTPDRLLVCDPTCPLGIAGVMGGLSSEVSEQTTRVLLEAAIWEPTTIRRAAQALRLPSEASRRFERGVDYELPPLMQRRALGLIQQISPGAVVAQGMIDVYSRPWKPRVLHLPPSEIARIVGIELSAQEIAGLLRPLGFGCEVAGDPPVVRVDVPSFRQDVAILADLCEEVARMYGYDRVPETLLSGDLPEQRSNPSLELEQKVRDLLAGSGLDEAITYSLTNMESVAKLNPRDADAALHLRLSNPITLEREYMRRSLLPTLLEALALNLREQERVLLFEIGRAYLPRAGQTLPDEPLRLALALAGLREPLSWLTPNPTPMDFFDLKGIVEELLDRLNIRHKVQFVPLRDDPRLHPGRAAQLILRAEGDRTSQDKPPPSSILGVLGELHPDARERLELEAPRVLAAELELEVLIGLAEPVRYQPISRYPATTQDIAVLAAQDVPAERVAAVIRAYAGANLESLTLFDVYEGPQIGPGKRSLAYRLAFRAPDRTLSDAEVNKVRAKIGRGLEREIGAAIRG